MYCVCSFIFQIISNFNYLSIILPHVSTESMIVLSHMFIVKTLSSYKHKYSHCINYKSSLFFCLGIIKLLFINPSEYDKSRRGVQLRWLLIAMLVNGSPINQFPIRISQARQFSFSSIHVFVYNNIIVVIYDKRSMCDYVKKTHLCIVM